MQIMWICEIVLASMADYDTILSTAEATSKQRGAENYGPSTS